MIQRNSQPVYRKEQRKEKEQRREKGKKCKEIKKQFLSINIVMQRLLYILGCFRPHDISMFPHVMTRKKKKKIGKNEKKCEK